MAANMKVLFIGRFQPFHKGHLRVVQEASKKYDEVIIGIGSSQYSDTSDNPFTFEERELMIKKTLEKTGIDNYKIISIPDIHNPPKWANHVLSIVSDFDVIISNNSLTKRLFSEKDYTVKETPLYEKKKYSGREIRRRMMDSEPWDDLVPTEVSNFIKDIDGVNRVKELSNK